MGYFRFSRHIGILPGLKLNLSKSGVSLSAGVRGAHLTIGKTPRITVGLPGTGISYSETVGHQHHHRETGAEPAQPVQSSTQSSPLDAILTIIGGLMLLAIGFYVFVAVVGYAILMLGAQP
jgi:hypothetical protein